MLKRIEQNIETGEQTEIAQFAFRVAEGPVQVADADSLLPVGAVLLTADDLQELRDTPVQMPRVVSMRQARLALLAMGLLDDVETALGLLPAEQQRAARIEWEYATEVRSDNGTVELLADTIGLDIDALFALAASIE